jgi:hypothetical protein
LFLGHGCILSYQPSLWPPLFVVHCYLGSVQLPAHLSGSPSWARRFCDSSTSCLDGNATWTSTTLPIHSGCSVRNTSSAWSFCGIMRSCSFSSLIEVSSRRSTCVPTIKHGTLGQCCCTSGRLLLILQKLVPQRSPPNKCLPTSSVGGLSHYLGGLETSHDDTADVLNRILDESQRATERRRSVDAITVSVN